MVSRREVLSHSALAGLVGTTLGAGGAPEVQEGEWLQKIADRAAELVSAFKAESGRWRLYSCGAASTIREAQKLHCRTNGRFPAWIDVGIDVWFELYDWHVANQQPIAVGRTPEGRYYTLVYMQTAVVLRHDAASPTYVGLPYDER
jgi:hypothetical protein